MRHIARVFQVTFFAAITTASSLAESPELGGPPADYFLGKYEVIGRKPGSNATYSGTLELTAVPDDAFVVIRRVGDHKVEGTAALERASSPADHPVVLRVQFKYGGHEYEGTFLWRSDFDNYPRLTGLIFERGKKKSVGLEAWFPVHPR